jgi:hypothetical protein
MHEELLHRVLSSAWYNYKEHYAEFCCSEYPKHFFEFGVNIMELLKNENESALSETF